MDGVKEEVMGGDCTPGMDSGLVVKLESVVDLISSDSDGEEEGELQEGDSSDESVVDTNDRHSDSDGEYEGDTSDESVHDSDSDGDYEGSGSDSGGDDGGAASAGDAGDAGDGPDVHSLWLPVIGQDPEPQDVPFTAVPGPKHAPPPDAKPIDYVNLFFTPRLVGRIVDETNTYSQEWINAQEHYLRRKPTSVVHQWIKKGETTQEELRAFLGICLNMSLIKKSTISSYWDASHSSQKTPWFNEHFSRDRFQLLLKFLHFNNNREPPPDDPRHELYKVQPLIDHFNDVFLHYYHPGMDISIDESMAGFKGKTPHLRMFMPQKRHARFGVKLWCVCDSQNGYTSRFEVCRGRNRADPVHPRDFTYDLVTRLLTDSNFLHRGHHLSIDNCFSSPDLFLDLYQQDTTATGTVRKNRRGLPRAAISQRLKNQQVSERRKGPLLCVVYKDGGQKPVLLSTAASAGFVDVTNKRGKTVQKPKVVVKYNEAMGGVDLNDARFYKYLSERRTMKWTLKVAFSLFGRAILNSYILYTKNTSDVRKLTKYQFMVEVVEGLAGNYFPQKVVRRRRTMAEIQAARENLPELQVAPAQPAQLQQGPAGAGHELRKLRVGHQRNCVAGHDRRVRSSYECPVCDVGLCPQCFGRYHRR